MPEAETVAGTPPEVVFTVNRNGIDAPFVKETYKKGKDNKGKQYPRLYSEGMTPAQRVQWHGQDIIDNWLQAKDNLIAQALHWEATHDVNEQEQEFDQEEFIKLMSSLSARSDSLKVINEKIQEALELMQEVAVKVGGDLNNGQFKAAMQSVLDLKDAYAKKKRKKEEVEGEAAVPA